MSYFVIINGPLGCGKTTNAKKLASVLNGKYISLDLLLKENNLEDIGPEGNIRASSFIQALNIVIPEVKQLLKKDIIVILDGCFYHKEVLDHLIKSLKFPHYIFTLKAPVDVCIKRDSLRENTLGEDATIAVYNLVSKYNFGEIINANKSFEETYKEILSYLPAINNKLRN